MTNLLLVTASIAAFGAAAAGLGADAAPQPFYTNAPEPTAADTYDRLDSIAVSRAVLGLEQ